VQIFHPKRLIFFRVHHAAFFVLKAAITGALAVPVWLFWFGGFGRRNSVFGEFFYNNVPQLFKIWVWDNFKKFCVLGNFKKIDFFHLKNFLIVNDRTNLRITFHPCKHFNKKNPPKRKNFFSRLGVTASFTIREPVTGIEPVNAMHRFWRAYFSLPMLQDIQFTGHHS